MPSAKRYEASFFTATILEWKFLLTNTLYKDIIVNSLRFHVEKKKIMVNAFVIMDNHIHLIWHILDPYKREDIQRNFLKYTAQTIIADLKNSNPKQLQEFYIGTKDRTHQIWERGALSVGLWSEDVLKQKLNYVHSNPVRAGLCEREEDYKYSSASVYCGGNDWNFVEPVLFIS